MEQMIDQSFNKSENTIALLRAPFGNSESSPFGRKMIWEEKEFLKTTQEKENAIEENFTATYWG